jgi:hypothetical protein
LDAPLRSAILVCSKRLARNGFRLTKSGGSRAGMRVADTGRKPLTAIVSTAATAGWRLSAVHPEAAFMPRTIFALTVLFCSLSPALATLSPRTAPPPADDKLTAPVAIPLPQERALPPEVVQAAYPHGQDDEYRITTHTDVFLDGRPCRYCDVPKNAVILKMEVSSDDRAVLSIHFRSKK